MKRFLIFDPKSKSYIRFARGGWTSGHIAEEVNSYATLEEARKSIHRFDSLKHCEVVEVIKTVMVVQNHTP